MKYSFLGALALTAYWVCTKPGRNTSLPSIKGLIETVHSLPGRLRLSIPLLIKNAEAAEMLREKMGRIGAVESIRVNTATGSVLIQFDPDKVDAIILFGVAARVLGIDQEGGARPDPLLWRELKAVADGLNDAVYNASAGLLDVKTLVALAMMAGLVHGTVTRRLRLVSPGVVTLGWWTYQHLFVKGAR